MTARRSRWSGAAGGRPHSVEHDRWRRGDAGRRRCAGLERWVTPPIDFLPSRWTRPLIGQVWQSAFDGVGERAIQTRSMSMIPISASLRGRARELSAGGPGGRLYLEGLATALTCRSSGRRDREAGADAAQRRPRAAAGCAVLEFIAAHLGDSIRCWGGPIWPRASPSSGTHHFGEAFKTATAAALPLRHGPRVERARELLRDGERPDRRDRLCRRVFPARRISLRISALTGVTPGRFRRSLADAGQSPLGHWPDEGGGSLAHTSIARGADG